MGAIVALHGGDDPPRQPRCRVRVTTRLPTPEQAVYGHTAAGLYAEYGAGRGDALRQALYPPKGAPHELVMVLEEYELPFKPTRQVRWQLIRHGGR